MINLSPRVIAVVLAAVIGFALSAHIRGQAGRIADLERDNARATALALSWETRWRDEVRAQAARRETERRLAEENEALAARLREVYERDPEAGAWADTPLPDSVVRVLLDKTSAGSAVGLATGSSGAGVEGADQRVSGPVGAGPADGPEAGQRR